MSKTGYYEALKFQEDMLDKLTKNTQLCHMDRGQLTGLWDMAVDIELLDEPSLNPLVWSYHGKTYSTKAFNVRFSLHKVLVAALEFGSSFTIPDSAIRAVFSALLILLTLLEMCTVKLSEEHARVLIKCQEMKADLNPIYEDELLQATGTTSAVLTDLSQLGCIELNQGTVRINESILIGSM